MEGEMLPVKKRKTLQWVGEDSPCEALWNVPARPCRVPVKAAYGRGPVSQKNEPTVSPTVLSHWLGQPQHVSPVQLYYWWL